MEQPAARDVGHEHRRGGREARAVDALGNIVEHARRIAALLVEFRVEPLGEDFRPRPIGRGSRDLIEIGEDMIERLLAKRLGERPRPAPAAR